SSDLSAAAWSAATAASVAASAATSDVVAAAASVAEAAASIAESAAFSAADTASSCFEQADRASATATALRASLIFMKDSPKEMSGKRPRQNQHATRETPDQMNPPAFRAAATKSSEFRDLIQNALWRGCTTSRNADMICKGGDTCGGML